MTKILSYLFQAMKHLKFSFAEPVAGIQRVRNEVFLAGDKLMVSSRSLSQTIIEFLGDCGCGKRRRPAKTNGAFYEVELPDGYHYEISNDGDEIIVMKGRDSIWSVNELGTVSTIYKGDPTDPCRIPSESPVDLYTDNDPLCWDER